MVVVRVEAYARNDVYQLDVIKDTDSEDSKLSRSKVKALAAAQILL